MYSNSDSDCCRKTLYFILYFDLAAKLQPFNTRNDQVELLFSLCPCLLTFFFFFWFYFSNNTAYKYDAILQPTLKYWMLECPWMHHEGERAEMFLLAIAAQHTNSIIMTIRRTELKFHCVINWMATNGWNIRNGYKNIDLGIWAALGRAGMRFSRAPWKRSK